MYFYVNLVSYILYQNQYINIKILQNLLKPILRAWAHQKKFGEKIAGEIESKKDHSCIPMAVRTQKARLACVTAGG